MEGLFRGKMGAVRLEVVSDGSRFGGFSMGDGVGWLDGNESTDSDRRIWVVKIMSFQNDLWLYRPTVMGSDFQF
ncbi:hypothetical protein V6N13_130237 [Hibiscus sabdariffa]